MGSLSPAHWLVILVVVLLIFGPSRLGDAGRGLGEGIRNLKKGLKDATDPPEVSPKAPTNATVTPEVKTDTKPT